MSSWRSLSWQIQTYYLLVLFALAAIVSWGLISHHKELAMAAGKRELTSTLATCRNALFPEVSPEYFVPPSFAKGKREAEGQHPPRGKHQHPPRGKHRHPPRGEHRHPPRGERKHFPKKVHPHSFAEDREPLKKGTSAYARRGGERQAAKFDAASKNNGFYLHYVSPGKELLKKRVNEGWFAIAYTPFGEANIQAGSIPKSFDEAIYSNKQEGLHFYTLGDMLVLRECLTNGGQFIMGAPLEIFISGQEAYQMKVIFVSLAIVVFLFFLGVGFVNLALKPIQKIHDTARSVALGNFDARITHSGFVSKEVSEISDNLNKTFSNFESFYQKQEAFTSDVAHELRTPIAGMMHQLRIGLDCQNTEKKNEIMLRNLESAERMTNITNGLLEIAKVDHHRYTETMAQCQMHLIAMDVVSHFYDKALDKGLELRYKDLPEASVLGHQELLWQLLSNLVGNAIAYTAKGFVEIRIDLSYDKVMVRVIDSGAGISESERVHLEQRFFRGNVGEENRAGGCGLGLTICSRIAELHSTTIQVESEIGKGSEFLICFKN